MIFALENLLSNLLHFRALSECPFQARFPQSEVVEWLRSHRSIPFLRDVCCRDEASSSFPTHLTDTDRPSLALISSAYSSPSKRDVLNILSMF